MTSAQTGYAEAVAWSKREAPKASTAPPRKATHQVQPWWHPAALVSSAFAYAYLLFLFVGLLGRPRGWGLPIGTMGILAPALTCVMEPNSMSQPGMGGADEMKQNRLYFQWEVWEAYKRVKANKGAAGVDEQTITDFERDLKGNLYKIWNRMSSGSYFPPPVRTVKIPKANGGERKLGIPTVSDRIAQMVVKSRLEPVVDPLFHPDSFGYRPRKSALDAVGQARQRCWRYDWIIDLDIKGFFDNIPQIC